MIEVSSVQFLENPAYIQLLAKTEPVIVNNGDGKQVLVNYDEFMQAKSKINQPFVSLYEAFVNIPEDLQKALVELDDDIEEDFSFARHNSKE